MAKGDKPKGPEVGLLFPKDPRKPDERGSTYGNKGAWAAAVGAISEKDAERIQKEKQWRNNYTKYVNWFKNGRCSFFMPFFGRSDAIRPIL